MDEHTVSINTKCPMCGDIKDFVLDRDRFKAWKDGEHIQVAFPEMTPDDRERLITGICEPCWDKAFD